MIMDHDNNHINISPCSIFIPLYTKIFARNNYLYLHLLMVSCIRDLIFAKDRTIAKTPCSLYCEKQRNNQGHLILKLLKQIKFKLPNSMLFLTVS